MPDEKKFNPTYAEPSTQYTSSYPFSDIIFPENVPVMSADLNELQAISNKKIADLLVETLCSNNSDDYISGNGLGEGGYWIPISYNEVEGGTNVVGYFVNKARTESYRVDLTYAKVGIPLYLKATSVVYAGEDDEGEGLTNVIMGNSLNQSFSPPNLHNYLQENSFNESINRRHGYKFELTDNLPENLTGSSYILIYDGNDWAYPSHISMFDNSKSQEDFGKIDKILNSIWLFKNPEKQRDIISKTFSSPVDGGGIWSLDGDADINLVIGKVTAFNDWQYNNLSYYIPAKENSYNSISFANVQSGYIFQILERGLTSQIANNRYFIYCSISLPGILILAKNNINDAGNWTIINHYECGRNTSEYIYENSELPFPTDAECIVLFIGKLSFEGKGSPWKTISLLPSKKCGAEEKFANSGGELNVANYYSVGHVAGDNSIYEELTSGEESNAKYPYLPKVFVDLFEPKYPIFMNPYYILPGGEKVDAGGNTRRYEQVYTISVDEWIFANGSSDATITVCGTTIRCGTWYYMISDEIASAIPTNATLIADISLDNDLAGDSAAVQTMMEAYQNVMKIVGVNPDSASDPPTGAILLTYDSKPDASFKIRLTWFYNY